MYGSTQMQVISRPDGFTPKKEPRYPLNRMMGGPQSRSRGFEEEKNLLPLPAFETQTVQAVA